MFLSMNWISDFVDFTGLDKVELIHRFSLSTAEVENEIFFKGSDISGIVVAEIKSVENHPDSKKLHLLKVDAGDGQLTDVVCGAPNVRVGLKTAFAKVGAKIGEIEIAPRKLAGYTSNGMCCSEKEIGISDDNSGIMEITDDLPMVQILKMHIRLMILFLKLIINLSQTVLIFGAIMALPVNLQLLPAENLSLLKLLIYHSITIYRRLI